MKDPLLIRQFLFKAVEEINNDLIKNNEQYRVDYGCDIGTHFLMKLKLIWKNIIFITMMVLFIILNLANIC